MPKQNIILVRVEDERVQHTGVAAGMSGSPIYIRGKLAGALAYAWTFAKEPLAGITPIESMLRDSRRPIRKKRRTRPALVRLSAPMSISGFGHADLRRVSVPLALSGIEPAAHTLPSCACAINIVYRRLT